MSSNTPNPGRGRPVRLGVFASVAACALAAGCGGSGDGDRYHVSGKVTFKNQGVPAGRISFAPDSSKKNKGVHAVTDIKNGGYDTRQAGKGGPGGAVVVRIEGFDGNKTEQLPLGKMLFMYQTQTELPRENSTKDFEVPPEAAKNVPKGGPPV